jgi:hypothetical protein
MKLKMLLVLSFLLSTLSAFAHDHGRGNGHGYNRGGYGRGHGRDRGHGRSNGDADALLSLFSVSLSLASTSGNELGRHKEQLVAVKSDAINFLAGETQTESLKEIISTLRESNTELADDKMTEEQIALNIITLLE